jgi:hypothetical protein
MLSVTYRLRPKKHLRNKTQQLSVINTNCLLTHRGLSQDKSRPQAADVPSLAVLPAARQIIFVRRYTFCPQFVFPIPTKLSHSALFLCLITATKRMYTGACYSVISGFRTL